MNDIDQVRVRIGMALDMLQIITEDVEDNLLPSSDNAVKARAAMTISMLYILTDFLRDLCGEAK